MSRPCLFDGDDDFIHHDHICHVGGYSSVRDYKIAVCWGLCDDDVCERGFGSAGEKHATSLQEKKRRRRAISW